MTANVQTLNRSKLYTNLTLFEASRSPSMNPDAFIDFFKSVTAKNCHRFRREDLKLREDVAFGKEIQYGNEARMALRLANFISAFSQIVNQKDIYSGKKFTRGIFSKLWTNTRNLSMDNRILEFGQHL